MINCIYLQQGIWELAQGEWADVTTLYVTGKLYKHRIWL